MSGAFDLNKFKALFTLYRIGFAPERKPYRIRLLYTRNNHDDFGAISLTKRTVAPRRSLSGESHIGEEFTPFRIAFRVSVRSYPA